MIAANLRDEEVFFFVWSGIGWQDKEKRLKNTNNYE
jgi:hypothetical protein